MGFSIYAGAAHLTSSPLTTSGDMDFAGTVSGQLQIKSTSGEIELGHTSCGAVKLATTSGDVRGSLLSRKNFITHTTSGSVHVPAPNASAVVCEITTTSGDIWITVPEGWALVPHHS